MTEREDAKLAARYRALATEEPSAVLDDALRAAARRAAASAPGGFRASRWAVPASIAAVLMLSFGVVLRMQQEQPGVESSLPAREAVPVTPSEVPKETLPRAETPPAPAPQSAPVPKPMLAQKPVPAVPEKKATTDSAPAFQQKRMAAPEAAEERPAQAAGIAAPAQAAPPALAAPSAFPAPLSAQSAPVPRAKAEAGASADASEKGRTAPETPEKALERIAELRRAGRDKEADEALAKFRREHPDYKIPAEMWERVRPR